MANNGSHVIWFEKLGRDDVPRVGGKNASLGEMVGHLASQGVRVPPGFATTADAYWQFVAANDLKKTIVGLLDDLVAGKAPLRSWARYSPNILTC